MAIKPYPSTTYNRLNHLSSATEDAIIMTFIQRRHDILSAIVLVAVVLVDICKAFTQSHSAIQQNKISNNIHKNKLVHFDGYCRHQPYKTTTTLHNGIIIDVPDDFFTATFFSIGLFYSLGKAYNRYLLEEVAFEQRKFEARERKLQEDPTLSELDVRREESMNWPSVYARKFRGEGETYANERNSKDGRKRGRGGGVAVLDREDDELLDEDEFNSQMTDEEINAFESTYGVEYDPYYDEPYEESGKYM